MLELFGCVMTTPAEQEGDKPGKIRTWWHPWLAGFLRWQQFQHLGKEFAMQHLGSEDEMRQAIRDLFASVPVEQRLEGLSPEERLKGLTPEQLEHLKELLQRQTIADDNSKTRD
jgi:hypothetical protein